MLGPAPRLRAIQAVIGPGKNRKAVSKKLNAFLNKTYVIAEKRNRIVHDPIYLDIMSRETVQLQITARDKLTYKYVPATVAEMNRVVTEIREHRQRFRDINREIFSPPQASPSKRQLQPPSPSGGG